MDTEQRTFCEVCTDQRVCELQDLRSLFKFCPACGESLEQECQVDDPCIANLPDVNDACCGHGCIHSAYVGKVEDRKWYWGKKAIEYFITNGKTSYFSQDKLYG